MATVRWIANAKKVAQVNAITPANVGVGNTFTVTINSKSLTFTATAGTVANVTAGLVALCGASTAPPEFQEITWTDSTTHVTATCKTAGLPFTQTSSATGGTATNVTATTTANSSPNDVGDTKNWHDGSINVLPLDADEIYIENTAEGLLYNLDALAAVNPISIYRLASHTGEIGLPIVNPAGYQEYRPTRWKLGGGVGVINIYQGKGEGTGSSRTRINVQAAQCNQFIYSTGSPIDTNIAAYSFIGSHASNALTVFGGSVDIAYAAGETATINTYTVNGGTVRFGVGVGTIASGLENGGTVETNQQVTALTCRNSLHTHHNGALPAAILESATLVDNANETVTAITVGAGSLYDLSQDVAAKTVTTCTVNAGGSVNDPHRRVTFTNPIILHRCRLNQVGLELGSHITIQRAAGA